MKVNSIARVVLCLILGIFSSPTLLNSVSASSLLDKRADRQRTAREKHSGKLLVRDPFPNTPDITRRRPVPVLRIRGRTPARVPPGEHYLPRYSRLPEVSVTCSRSGFVLRVKKNFYGFSAIAEELTLGETCKSNGVLVPHNDLLFTYALTDCQGEQQVFPDYVAYKYVLHYVPLSHRNSLHYHRVNVGLECRYKREHHVHSLVVSPTSRTLLHKLIRSRSGDFWIQLMDGSWSSPVRSAVYLLGQQVNVQVSTRHHYQGVKLFINSCYAATVNTLSQATKHSIIDNYGCLRESRINPGASRFRFSRADNVVQFSFGAFQFIEAPDAQIAVHCELSVSGGGPSPMQKSCFYSHNDKRWVSVFGQDSICDCCDSVCNQTKTKRIAHEGFVSSDQVLFSDHLTSPFSTLPSSTLESIPIAHRSENVIWFEAKLDKESQRSYTHKDLVASVSLISTEEDHDKRQHTSNTSTVEFTEEERKEIEEEKHGDVEIIIAISKNIVGSERPDLDPMKLHDIASLDWSEDRKMQNLTKGSDYSQKKGQRVEQVPQDHKGSTKTSVMASETMEENPNMDLSTMGDIGQLGKKLDVHVQS
uniref:Zona pellucida sperm-binding protein 3 n=1 Tax=Cyprinus carpio TaxID=7962 RepID=A0A8C1MYP6_CYPCA